MTLHQRISLTAAQAALTRARTEVETAIGDLENGLGKEHELARDLDQLRDDLRVMQARIARAQR